MVAIRSICYDTIRRLVRFLRVGMKCVENLRVLLDSFNIAEQFIFYSFLFSARGWRLFLP